MSVKSNLLATIMLAQMMEAQNNKKFFVDFERPSPKVIIPKGCKKYNFPGFSCIAISEKSANTKYEKFLKKNRDVL